MIDQSMRNENELTSDRCDDRADILLYVDPNREIPLCEIFFRVENAFELKIIKFRQLKLLT